MKPCPRCEALCPDGAIVCPHCGYLFSTEMRDGQWKEAPWRPEPGSRNPRRPGRFGGTLPTDTAAMLALAFGLTALAGAWVVAGIPLAVAGIVCGLLARRRIRRTAGALGGESCADAGVALSVMALGVGICMIGWIALHWPEFYRDFPQSWDSALRQLRS